MLQLWYQLIKALQRRGKHGLLAAAEQMKDEAALLGIITLLLSVFEGPITGSCGETDVPGSVHVFIPVVGQGRGKGHVRALVLYVHTCSCTQPACIVLMHCRRIHALLLRCVLAVRASLYKTSWLDAVNGCACCLTHTGGVSPCFLSNRDCGLSDQLAECCAQHSVDQVGSVSVCACAHISY